MSPSEVFSIANTVTMPMWLLMIVVPKWRFTRILIDYKIIPLLLSVLYVIYIVQAIGAGGMDFASLESVMTLFTMEEAVLAGWVHYLAFDLLVGMWIVNQNQSLKLHPLILAPCLFGTFMLGPIGFLVFMIIRTIKISRS